MPLLYKTLRHVLRGALGLYYVDIQSTGQEKIPKDSPLIFAANHPNSIMDTVMLGAQTSRTISYMARSGLFKNPLVALLFHQCGVIPVYRAQDDPTQTHRNAESFQRAYDVLAEGGAIGIFPEGKNSLERHVKQIKTGTARIALGAETSRDQGIGLQIIPVGLNFVARDRFLSSVLVRFGDPIQVNAYTERYTEDPKTAVRALTDTLEQGLKEVATHMEDDRTVALARDVYAIYGSTLLHGLLDDWGSRHQLAPETLEAFKGERNLKTNLDDRFWLKQRIADAIAFYSHKDPELLEQIDLQVQNYKDHLDQLRLRHHFRAQQPETRTARREALKFTLYAVFLAPLAAWGFLLNVVPYGVARYLANRAPDEAQRGFVGFCVALVLFPVVYALQMWGLLWLTEGNLWVALAHPILAPLAGFLFLRWRRQIVRYRSKIVTRTLFFTNQHLFVQIKEEREALLHILEDLKERFVADTESKIDAHLADTVTEQA